MGGYSDEPSFPSLPQLPASLLPQDIRPSSEHLTACCKFGRGSAESEGTKGREAVCCVLIISNISGSDRLKTNTRLTSSQGR